MTLGSPKVDNADRGFLGFLRAYQKAVTRYMVTGLMVWVPLIITVWLLWWFITRFIVGLEVGIAGMVFQLGELAQAYPALYFLDWIEYRRGFGVLITFTLFLATGFLTRFLVGRRLIATGERIVQQIPLISRIYRAVQQIRDTFVNREGAVFQKTVLIEFPRKGIWSVAFLTSDQPRLIEAYLNKDLVALFMPTTPNFSTGFLIYLPAEEVIEIDITTEDAFKMVVSCGAYQPEAALLALEAKRKAEEEEPGDTPPAPAPLED